MPDKPAIDRETECRLLAMLQCTHAMLAETDRIAALIADLSGLEPDDEAITEAVFNAASPAEGVMILKGDLPRAGFDA